MSEFISSINFESLKGEILQKIEIINDNDCENEEIHFFCKNKDYKIVMTHHQDCCESVQIEDICGELENLIDSPVLVAEERTNHEDDEEKDISSTWTFYEVATLKGSVTIRWYGTSNGYYSESVSVEKRSLT